MVELSDISAQIDALNGQAYVVIVLLGIITGIMLFNIFWRDVR